MLLDFSSLNGIRKRGNVSSNCGLQEYEYKFWLLPLICPSNEPARFRLSNSAPLKVFLFKRLKFNRGPVKLFDFVMMSIPALNVRFGNGVIRISTSSNPVALASFSEKFTCTNLKLPIDIKRFNVMT